MKRKWLMACLANFFIAALMGIALRFAHIVPLNFNYAFLLHAHSHTVILGWCYLAVYACCVSQFLPADEQQKPIYNRLFWITQLAVFGMMLTFPFQGYGLFSITFSTLHIFCSYYFCFLLYKNQKLESEINRALLGTALFFMLLSTLGVWCLGPLVSNGSKDAYYNLAIQFFLHFQFNGWFVFAVAALFIDKIQKSGIRLCYKTFRRCYKYAVAGTVLTFALPMYWYLSVDVLIGIHTAGLLFQLMALYYFIRLLVPNRLEIKCTMETPTKILYTTAAVCLVAKILLQAFTAFDRVAITVHAIRNLTVGFIHLIMIGLVSCSLLAFVTETASFNPKKRSGILGIILFLMGFIAMEFLLFADGMGSFIGRPLLANFNVNILIASVILASGLLLVLINVLQTPKKLS